MNIAINVAFAIFWGTNKNLVGFCGLGLEMLLFFNQNIVEVNHDGPWVHAQHCLYHVMPYLTTVKRDENWWPVMTLQQSDTDIIPEVGPRKVQRQHRHRFEDTSSYLDILDLCRGGKQDFLDPSCLIYETCLHFPENSVGLEVDHLNILEPCPISELLSKGSSGYSATTSKIRLLHSLPTFLACCHV